MLCMMKDGLNQTNRMLQLERENSRLKLEIKLLTKRIQKYLLSDKKKNILGGSELDLFYILMKK